MHEPVTEDPPARPGERICSIIIPCRNEATTLNDKLRNCLELKASGWVMENIVCADVLVLNRDFSRAEDRAGRFTSVVAPDPPSPARVCCMATSRRYRVAC